VEAAPCPEQPTPTVSYSAAAETLPREILFLDPGVSDIETLLSHLRPEIEAILLDPVRPAARQMAAALAERHALDAVHVIAHGAPGRISFAAGDWSAATLAEVAEDLAAISRALGAGRNINLWSCHTAAGPAGAAFIAGLARASGADIARRHRPRRRRRPRRRVEIEGCCAAPAADRRRDRRLCRGAGHEDLANHGHYLVNNPG
jgi:hypothetical protein